MAYQVIWPGSETVSMSLCEVPVQFSLLDLITQECCISTGGFHAGPGPGDRGGGGGGGDHH